MDITPEVIEAFRADFSGFASSDTWADPVLTRALARADKETGSARWGEYDDFSIKQRGMFNFAAHSLSLNAANTKATAMGGTPSATAQVQSKTVADESVTFAVGVSGSSVDDSLKATAYGQEFIRLRRRVGAGGANSMSSRSGVVYG